MAKAAAKRVGLGEFERAVKTERGEEQEQRHDPRRGVEPFLMDRIVKIDARERRDRFLLTAPRALEERSRRDKKKAENKETGNDEKSDRFQEGVLFFQPKI